jgi:cell fate regulator YaaT (PSP1 superfamily)
MENLLRGEKVVIRTERGTELGTVVSPSDGSNQDGRVLRRGGPEDLERAAEIERDAGSAEFDYCREKITELGLPMKLVHVEHLLGGEKIVFYFMADGRVDFRALVRDLARKYQTRIELRQIGVRDEARLLADYDTCGRELCCRTFMKDLEPVTMRMAKNQKATLDPSKISGHCGRLMCCLRYEDAVYDELKRKLPKKGSTVVTKEATGEVIDYDILQQTVRIEAADSRLLTVAVDDILEVTRHGRSAKRGGPKDAPESSGDSGKGTRAASGEGKDREEADAGTGESNSTTRRQRRRSRRSRGSRSRPRGNRGGDKGAKGGGRGSG